MDVHVHTHAPSPASLFFFLLPRLRASLDSDASPSYPPAGGGGNAHASVVCRFPHPRPPVKLSLLSANFPTCAKLKALMRKRRLPLVSPLCSSLLSFHSVVCNLDLLSFSSSHLIYSAHCFCVGVCWCVSVWEGVRESLFARERGSLKGLEGLDDPEWENRPSWWIFESWWWLTHGCVFLL